MIIRHNKAIDEQIGRVVTELPNVKSVGEFAKFYVKQTDDTFIAFTKINGEWYQPYVDENSKVFYWKKA
jgi:hypothetical protein